MMKFYLMILLSMFLLTGCGSSSSESGETSSSNSSIESFSGVAQLGFISGGNVNLYEKDDLTDIIASTTTSTSIDINEAGSFTFKNLKIEPEKFYVIEVTGGYDIDSNDDGIIDLSTKVELKGKVYSLAKGSELQNNTVRVTALSDMSFLKIKNRIKDLENLEIENMVNSTANEYLYDINEDGNIDSKDLLSFNPISHKTKTKKSYKDILNLYVSKLHEGKDESSRISSLLYVDKPIIAVLNGKLQEVPFNLNASIDNLPVGLSTKWFLNDEEKNQINQEITTEGIYKIYAKVYLGDKLLKTLHTNVVATKKVEIASSNVFTNKDNVITVTDEQSGSLKGTKVIVPTGALSEDTEIKIKKASVNTIPETNGISITDVLILEPAGLTFEKPVQVKIPYSETLDLKDRVVRIARHSQGVIDYITPLFIDEDNHEIVFETEHFTEFKAETDIIGKSADEKFIDKLNSEFPSFNFDIDKWKPILNVNMYNSEDLTLYDVLVEYFRNKEIVQEVNKNNWEGHVNAYSLLYDKTDVMKNTFDKWKSFSKGLQQGIDVLNYPGYGKDYIENGAKKAIGSIIGVPSLDESLATSFFDYNSYIFDTADKILQKYRDIQLGSQIENYFLLRNYNHSHNSIESSLSYSLGKEEVDRDGTSFYNGWFNLGSFSANISQEEPSKKFWNKVETLYDIVETFNSLHFDVDYNELTIKDVTKNLIDVAIKEKVYQDEKEDFEDKPISEFENIDVKSFFAKPNENITVSFRINTKGYTDGGFYPRFEIHDRDTGKVVQELNTPPLIFHSTHGYEGYYESYVVIKAPSETGKYRYSLYYEDDKYFRLIDDKSFKKIDINVRNPQKVGLRDLTLKTLGISKDGNYIGIFKPVFSSYEFPVNIKLEFNGNEIDGSKLFIIKKEEFDDIKLKELTVNVVPTEKAYNNFEIENIEPFVFNLQDEIVSNLIEKCSSEEKLVNYQCITKTCEEDNYNCPICNSNQTLKYNTNGSGYCEDNIISDTTAPQITTKTSYSFSENKKIFISAKAIDESEVTYSLEGIDKHKFKLNHTSNIIFSIESTDFETQSEYNITLIATDSSNNSSSKDIKITIKNIVEESDCLENETFENNQCVAKSKVTSFSPNIATHNIETIFTILGENLPSTLALALQDAECESVNYISSSKATISCTPRKEGTKSFYIKDKSGGDKILSDVSTVVNVQENNNSNTCGLVKNNHTLASLLFNLDIDTTVYDNPGAVTAPYLMENYSQYIAGMEVHAGTDFRSKKSDGGAGRHEVYSLTDGEVVRADNGTVFGAVAIRLQNLDGETSLISYGHLDETNVSAGDNVKSGTLLGYTGDIGAPNAAHLHLEYRPNYNNISMVYNTSCGDTDCSKEEIQGMTDNPIDILNLYCNSEKLPILTTTTNAPKQENDEVTFTVNLSESFDSKYSVKIALGDNPEDNTSFLDPIEMSANNSNNIYTYSKSISVAGNRVYKVAIFDGDTRISTWVDGTYIVNENTTLTNSITHNGYTYGMVTSPYTGQIWLDRNLGASRVCESYDDELCYGDYYQWGRNADGHEKNDSNTTLIQSSNTVDVGHGDFILSSRWSTSDIVSRNWFKINGSSICPTGFKVPTIEELKNETINRGIDNRDKVFNDYLKIPSSGAKFVDLGLVNQSNSVYLWSVSLIDETSPYSKILWLDSNLYNTSSSNWGRGMSVRCLKGINTNPTANAGSDQTVTTGSNITLDASSSNDNDGTITSYSWSSSLGDNLGIGSTLTLNTLTEGTHRITLTVVDDGGLSDSDTVIITVNEGTPIVDTISHNGYIYGIVTSPITGKKWLDRNLGATEVCTKSRDNSSFSSDENYVTDQETCFGDYYQWGRLTDGHEKKDSSIIDTQAISISNVGVNFIKDSDDWTNADSDVSLRMAQWSKTDGSSICPIGFRVPTSEELYDETTDYSGINNEVTGAVKVIDRDTAFNNFLKFPSSGYRLDSTGALSSRGFLGYVWSNSVTGLSSRQLNFVSIDAYKFYNSRSFGFSVRCINSIDQEDDNPLSVEFSFIPELLHDNGIKSFGELLVTFNQDMNMGGYGTTGEYIPTASYWRTNRQFVVDFESYVSGGMITLDAESFLSKESKTLKDDVSFTFP